MSDKRYVFLWGLFLLQALCTVFFVGDAIIDIGRADQTPDTDIGDGLEYAVAFALLIGTVFTGLELRKLMQRDRRITRQLGIASGAFEDILEAYFQSWALTGAERDVALLAIKGYSVAEIAALRNTREGTIKAQNAAIYRKAGVSGRLQLLSLFIDDLMSETLIPDAQDRQAG